MEDKLVTLAILTYAKAQILKNVLENEGIETYIHNVNQIQPVVSSGVRVRIKESDLPHALKITESSVWLSEEVVGGKPPKVENISNKVIIPVDFSTYSMKACEFGFNFAQNIGAEKEERISQGYRMGNFMIIVIAVILCLFLEIAHKPLVALFLDNAASSQTIVTGESYLKFIGFFFCMIGFKMAVDGILRGAGAVRVFTIANLVNLTLRVTIAKFGAPIWGVSMVWYAVPLGWLANFLISYGYYRTGKWKEAVSKTVD